MPRSLHQVALGVCAFALPDPGDDRTLTIQLFPAGQFRPTDGRPLPVDSWFIDAAAAARVIAALGTRKNLPVLDYEHQTLHAESNGQPAPAAGWIKSLEWREGEGLFGVVELTARAAQMIHDGEYRYVSPVFLFNGKTGAVESIEMAAITNHPALDGMQPLALRAAARFQIGDDSMNALTKALYLALALADNATEDQAIAALTKHFEADPLTDVRKALGVADDADPTAVTAACKALVARPVAKPDPAQFVAVATFEHVKSELAALTAKINTRDVEELVEAGLADGRLLASQREWATELGASNLTALTKYLASTTPMAALTGAQTKGKQPEPKSADALTASELAVCKATGITPKDYAASKADIASTATTAED